MWLEIQPGLMGGAGAAIPPPSTTNNFLLSGCGPIILNAVIVNASLTCCLGIYGCTLCAERPCSRPARQMVFITNQHSSVMGLAKRNAAYFLSFSKDFFKAHPNRPLEGSIGVLKWPAALFNSVSSAP